MNGTANLISVIIPLYNAENYIAQALESVLVQTHKEFELIVVDDGSTDSSRAICHKFATEYRNVLLCLQENSGVGIARNMGLREASGEFVLFLDADDFLAEDALSSLLKCQRETGADFVIGAYHNVAEDGTNKGGRDYNFAWGANYPEYLVMEREEMLEFAVDFENYPSTHYIMGFCWGRLYKTALLRENDLQFSEKTWFADDSIFTLEYVSLANKMAIVKNAVLFYRDYDETVSISSRITEGEPILRDAQLFFDAAVKFMTVNNICDLEGAKKRTAWKVVGNIIIKMIKSTKDLTGESRSLVLREIRAIVNSSFTQELLKSYQPKPGDSKLLPLAMRLRFTRLVLYLCHQRALTRYSISPRKVDAKSFVKRT